MPTLPLISGHSTLVDIAKSLDPQGKVAVLAELLNQSNEIIYDMNFIEGNQPLGHKSVLRTALPVSTLRQFYVGVPPTKSGRATVEDVIAMRENRTEVDKDLAELGGNSDAYRLSESLAVAEGMNQDFAEDIFYANNAINKDGITGFTPRYNALSGPTGQNIINAGGTGNTNTSIWLIGWAENTISGFYPKGSKAGLMHMDLGEGDLFDPNGYRYRGYSDLWQWKYGLMVKDWRFAVRICNISVPDLVSQTNTQAITASTLINKLMMRAMQRIPSAGNAKFAFYANRTVKEMLSINAGDKSQNSLSYEEAVDQYGKIGPGSTAGTGTGITGGVLKFQGVPVRTVDKLLLTESTVS